MNKRLKKILIGSCICTMFFMISCNNNYKNEEDINEKVSTNEDEKENVVKVKVKIEGENKDIIKNPIIILQPFNEYTDKDAPLIDGEVNYSGNQVDKWINDIFEEYEYKTASSNTTVSGKNVLVYLYDSYYLNYFKYYNDDKEYLDITIDIAKSIREMLVDLLDYDEVEIGFWTNDGKPTEGMLFLVKTDGSVVTCFQEGEYEY